jgi:spermidine synthase
MKMQSQDAAGRVDASRSLPWLLILFAGSGCSALIYEIVWFQMLTLAIGSTAVSLGILLATFMGGLCIGSIFVPRMRAVAGQHPLRMYALLELGIAVCGILVLFGLPLIDSAFLASGGTGLFGMLFRGLVSAICLLPPTILMGATLPVIVRGIEGSPRGVSWWGALYGTNLVGAIFGTLFAGFYLLRIYNVATATYAAAAINLTVAAISFAVSAWAPSQSGTSQEQAPAPTQPAHTSHEAEINRGSIYLAIALSGATALGAQVIWTRLMGMMLGSTVYVFSIILAVFLAGLAIGSGLASMMVREVRPRIALGWCQFLLTLGIAWAAYIIADSLPYWPINPLLSVSPWYTFQLDLVRCLWAILPGTILWGASFPLALAAVASPSERPEQTVGKVYAANTFGAIIGALAVSLVLIPWIGTQQSQRILLVVSAMSALNVFLPNLDRLPSRAARAWLAVMVVVCGLLGWSIGPIPGVLVAYGRRAQIQSAGSQIVHMAEGRNSSAAIVRWSDGTIGIGVNGHVQASNIPFDMRLQRMVGHLPLLLHPNPKSVLGIGFGAGVTAGTFTRYPSVQKITICEIEPIIPPISTQYFGKENYSVFTDPRTHMVWDDARHYILQTGEKFDVIASDPLDIFAKGTAALYTKEYFDAIKAHLNPGGMFSLYIALYESDLRTVQSEFATFFAAFPNGTVWANTINGSGYDLVLLGQVDPLKVDLDEVQKRLESADYAKVAQSLQGISMNSVVDLLSTYTGQAADFAPWTKGAELNHDADLRLQYLAGWGINSTMENDIYYDMLAYRKPPDNIITGSPLLKNSLMSMLTPAVAPAN